MRTATAVELEVLPKSNPGFENRILAEIDGETKPMLAMTPQGLPSPSPSLLVERFEVPQGGRQTHYLNDHIVTLFLHPAEIHHARDRAKTSLYPIGSGEAVICIRDARETIAWENPISMLCVRVDETVLEGVAASMKRRATVVARRNPVAEDARISGLLHAIEGERLRGYPSGRLFLDSVEIALSSLLLAPQNHIELLPPPRKGGLSPRCRRRVIEFMREKVAEDVSLEQLAECAGMSLSNFSHQFRTSMNTSPFRYMRGLRVEEAKQMLRDEKMPILEIALRLGFERQQHFATVFRRVAGVTPTAYRRMA